MTRIRNTELVANAVGEWQPSDIAFFTSLLYDVDETTGIATLNVVGLLQPSHRSSMWPDKRGDWHRIAIRFHGVRQLRVASVGGPLQILDFFITDISDRGWEYVGIEAGDDESDALLLRCESAEILGIERLPYWPLEDSSSP